MVEASRVNLNPRDALRPKISNRRPILKYALQTKISFFAAVALLIGATSCATSKKNSQDSETPDSHEQSFVGPPSPALSYGPEPEDRQEVIVIIGPGMASALSGAGAIRALLDRGVQIAGVAGIEFGAMVSAAYAATASANQMDWSILQFQGEWVMPKEGLSRFLSPSRRSPKALADGLARIFRARTLEELKVPLWIFETHEGKVQGASSGALSTAVCRSLSSVPWMEPCGTDSTESSLRFGSFRESWEQAGLRLPVVWVVPARVTPSDETSKTAPLDQSIRVFAREAEASKRDQDLVVTPRAVIGDYFDYKHRSEVVYSGKQELSKHLDAWMSRLGWTRKRSR